MSFQEKFSEEKNKLRTMNGRARIGYIWDYYKFSIIFIIAVLSILVSVIVTMVKNSYDPYLSMAVINSNLDDERTGVFNKAFMDFAEIDSEKEKIDSDISVHINRKQEDTMSMASNAKLLAMLSAQTIDVVISDTDNFEFYGQGGAFSDLKTLLPDDLYQRAEPFICVLKTDDDTESLAYGVRLGSSRIFQEWKAYDEDAVLAITRNGIHKEAAVKLVEYFFQE